LTLPIVIWGDPLLRQKSRPLDPSELTDEFRAWCLDFTETMYEEDGVGLAAIQVGRPIRVFVADTQFGETNRREPVVYVNPVIEPVGAPCDADEGCLSVPGVRGKVRRAETINISWLDVHGVPHRRENIDGLEARCLQHENDHLEGVLFVDRLSPAARALAEGKLRRLARKA
jgi:peptide deformylase